MKEGMRVRVRVTAGARKETFVKKGSSMFEVSVKEKAKENAANGRVRTLFARHFGVPIKSVRILSGHHGKNKLLGVVA